MRNWKKAVACSLMAGALLAGTTTSANNAIPGSAEDPLVTKSYVDEKIAQIKGSGGSGNGNGSDTGSVPAGSAPLVVERLETGQKLIGEAGTEIIVRTGHVVAILGPGGNGIPNVTAGTDLRGTKVPLNHLLLIPRTDGRGIEVISGPSHVMIRGNYEIKKK